MRKSLCILIACLLCFANVSLASDAFKGSVIDATTLDNDPTEVTSDGVDISQYDKTTFYLTYDETEVGASLSAAVTVEVSYDDTTYVTANFYDVAGALTLQTTETISADATFIFWLDRRANYKYARVKVVGTGTDADDNIEITVVHSSQK